MSTSPDLLSVVVTGISPSLSNFGDKKQKFGYTNNPKYLNKKPDESFEASEKKNFSLKSKKRLSFLGVKFMSALR